MFVQSVANWSIIMLMFSMYLVVYSKHWLIFYTVKDTLQ